VTQLKKLGYQVQLIPALSDASNAYFSRVWQGSAGDRRPYADQTGFSETDRQTSDSGAMSRKIGGGEDEGRGVT
jgi:hypothetical protein